jgi:DnaJ family protein B protein 4
MNNDYYSALEVNRGASQEDIRKAYRRLALKHHPDKNPNNRPESEERFKLISRSYEILSDPMKRSEYDLRGSTPTSMRPGFPNDSPPSFQSFGFPFGRRSFDNELESAFRLFERMFERQFRAGIPFMEDAIFGNSAGGSFSQGGTYSVSSSTSSVSQIRNGKRITRTEKSIRYGDGRVESEVTEEVQDLRTGQTEKRVLRNGEDASQVPRLTRN